MKFHEIDYALLKMLKFFKVIRKIKIMKEIHEWEISSFLNYLNSSLFSDHFKLQNFLDVINKIMYYQLKYLKLWRKERSIRKEKEICHSILIKLKNKMNNCLF